MNTMTTIRMLLRGALLAVSIPALSLPALAAGTFQDTQAAPAEHWNTARWQALLNAVPPPPPTPAKAGGMIGPVTDENGRTALWVTDPALQGLHKQRLAGMNAMQTATLAESGTAVPGGIDYARMQSDPAYAKEMEQRMASMIRQQRMQMVRQMAQARSGSMSGAVAGGAVQNYLLMEQRARLDGINRNAGDELQRITADYDKRHAALDAALKAKLAACPLVNTRTQLRVADPHCVASINARVPALIAKHRQLAQAELNEERALFAHTRSALQPIMSEAANLAEAAENTSASAASLQIVYGRFDEEVHTLLSLTDTATVRAGFWQTIRPHKMVEFSTVGYRAPLDLTAPPEYSPKGW